jgi:ABC-type Fe3+-hydroxamate transport system substrate-binding protein
VYFAEKLSMIVTDQIGRKVELKNLPQRIISIVPSQTELLYDLGLEEQVVGITKFCIHPEVWFRSKTRVGGTKELNLERIADLKPHLILANKEENVQSQVEELARNFPVWASDVNNLDDALHMIGQIGALVGREDKAAQLVQQLQERFAQLRRTTAPPLKACYLIWKDPYMTVGSDTFIHNMLEHAGFINLFASASRYPEVTVQQIKELAPDVLLLSSEPYPFKQKHAEEWSAQLPNTKIVLVNGEAFSWYGSRLLHSPSYFEQLRQQIAMIS